MLERISRHIRANVVGYLALFVALSGTALASGVLNKKKVNKIISNRAPGLSVAHAKSADSATPSGPAGGDLTGTYPNAELKPGVVGTAETGTIPAARVTNSSDEAIPSGGSETTLTFDAEDFDNASLHSTSVNTSRLTAPTPGIYDVVGQVAWTTNTSGTRNLDLVKNGNRAAFSTIAPTSSGVANQEVTSQIALGAGDYVELLVSQDSGIALSVRQHSEWTPLLSMHWIGP